MSALPRILQTYPDLCGIESGYTHLGLASSHRFRRFLHVKQPDRDHLPPSRLYFFFVEAAWSGAEVVVPIRFMLRSGHSATSSVLITSGSPRRLRRGVEMRPWAVICVTLAATAGEN